MEARPVTADWFFIGTVVVAYVLLAVVLVRLRGVN